VKRPAGFTILSLLLGFLALGGFGNGAIQLKAAHGASMTAALDCAYALTALVSAIGLWRLKPWAFQSIMSWSVIVFLLMLNMQFGMFGIYSVPLYQFAVFALFVIALLALLLFYVKKNTRSLITGSSR
jgi:uncharacterized membrane protein (DUF2068 family)